MANYPNPIKQREELNLRLGIKSSLSQLRPVIASLYALYCANDRKVRFQYSQEINSNGFVSILLDDVLKTKIVNLYENEEVSQLIEKSQLFTSQLEALQVGLELFFHICKIDFVKGGLSERTGSNRYNKSISFSTNMLLLDLFLSSYSTEDVKKLLFNWLQDKEDDSGIENKLKIILNTFTEETQYKIRDEKSNEIIFNQEGVYSEILSSNTVASNDSKEQVGPYRVLKAYISSGLHPFLTDDKQLFYLRANVDHDIFSRYADMVDTTLTLIPKRSVVTQEIEVLQTEKPQNEPNNSIIPLQQIFYGAPGTGKSRKIKKNEQVKKAEEKNLVFRTTFHPDSDYSTFVGAYKPTMKPVADKYKAVAGKDEEITYSFVPQAFLQSYVAAWNNQDENVFLIIEEINRGNCAQIFGDIFQLLDRDENGVSEYKIKADADIRTYLEDALGKDADGIKDGELCLPKNLYIWATMNTSDQSLFPIDSAFKRRWDWEYEPIKYNNKEWVIEIGNNKYSWTSFQKKVNDRIFRDFSSEDKMLGDYFVNPRDGIISKKLLLNKILFYLWNDVCKDGDGDIFKTEENKEVKFSELYGEEGTEKLLSMMKHLKVELLDESKAIE